jgi:hypothetical protein
MKDRKAESLGQHLDELAAFESGGFPVVSLYLNTRPDQHGRDNFDSFVRKEFAAVAKSYAPESFERAGFERDAERIKAYLREELRPSSNGVAVFACAGAGDYFKALQLDVPFPRHRLHVGQLPHLYPLARLIDQHPRYVALVADTNSARLFVEDAAATRPRPFHGKDLYEVSHLQSYHRSEVAPVNTSRNSSGSNASPCAARRFASSSRPA